MHLLGLNDTGSDERCVELLIEASGKFDLREHDDGGRWPAGLEQDNKMMDLIKPLCENAHSLLHLCRFATRSYLGPCHLPSVVRKLHIPTTLQDYLLLKY